jgi:hypothetical protein
MKIALLCILVVLMGACQNAGKLEGEWKLVNIDYSRYIAFMDDEEATLFRGMIEAHTANLVNKTFFSFRHEGNLELMSPDQDGEKVKENGTWKQNEKLDSLFLTLTELESYKLNWLHGDTLELVTDEQPMRTIKLVRINN